MITEIRQRERVYCGCVIHEENVHQMIMSLPWWGRWAIGLGLARKPSCRKIVQPAAAYPVYNMDVRLTGQDHEKGQ